VIKQQRADFLSAIFVARRYGGLAASAARRRFRRARRCDAPPAPATILICRYLCRCQHTWFQQRVLVCDQNNTEQTTRTPERRSRVSKQKKRQPYRRSYAFVTLEELNGGRNRR